MTDAAVDNPGVKIRPMISSSVIAAIASAATIPRASALARTLVANLIGNAWKFTTQVARPRIEVGTTAQEGALAFYVRDNGAGFNKDFANKLFTPFQRLHTTREFPGTGIGLATVQRIVHRHGGRVWAEGSVNAGATFYFRIPPHALGAHP